jgi:hypothetical protein
MPSGNGVFMTRFAVKGEDSMRIRAFCTFLLFMLILTNAHLLFSKNPPPVSDPQALALAAKALTALSNGVVVTDVTLTGTANWTAGSVSDKGTVTLKARGATQTRMDLALSERNRSEIRTASNGFPQGAWISSEGKSTAYASHNCLTDASWFFPLFSSLAVAQKNEGVVLSYVGQEKRNEASVEHLQASTYSSDFPSLQPWSTVDFYLDARSLLPVTTTFNTHPDDNAGDNIAVEVDFADYKLANGVLVPFGIQQFVQGSLALDIAVSAVALNSGLPDSDFSIQ